MIDGEETLTEMKRLIEQSEVLLRQHEELRRRFEELREQMKQEHRSKIREASGTDAISDSPT